MLAFALIFGAMLIVQHVTYTVHSVMPRRVRQRIGIGTRPSFIGGVIQGFFVTSMIDTDVIGWEPPSVEGIASTPVVNEPMVGTALALSCILNKALFYKMTTPAPPEIADHAFDWAAEVRIHPELYLDDLVPCPRDSSEDYFCRRWQMHPSGALKRFGPRKAPRRKTRPSEPAAKRSKPATKKSKPATKKSKPTSRKSKPASKPASGDSKPRRPHPRLQFPPGSYTDLVTILLQCLAFQYLHEWLLDNSADDLERRTWIPTWICALFSATITFGIVSVVPPSEFSDLPLNVVVPVIAYCCCALMSMVVTRDDSD
ncbi:hypothetical protein BS17DRAFT_434309 [Gyrodon lividus]|nr:hypothetical protein BS17DRAFT_434309 [Gyrodon lividus]